jgi:2-polyprenyl-6-methoxyphenol hydroxylase-like FAD-dependent oxidoreductase
MPRSRGDKILVVGGGPAGCATAITLLKQGFNITLFESGGVNRDKICGDAFLPDAQNALKELGVFEMFQKEALNPHSMATATKE